MLLEPEKYDEIKKIIIDIFDDYNINTLPIDIFFLARKMKIKIIKYEDYSPEKQDVLNSASEDGISFYRPREKRYYIVYKDVGNSGRIRFTIAHEIGHIVLGHTESNDEVEVEANFFAGQLLVPQGILVNNRITDISDIVESFDVSSSCAEVALNCLNTRYYYWEWEIFDSEIPLLKQFGMRKRR